MRWLWILLLPSLAFAGNPDPSHFSGIETYRFRNGVYPDVSYAGMVMQQINQKAKTTTYTAWTSAAIGDTLGSARFRTLWKCDLSTLPDSAVVNRATLRFLLAYPTVSKVFRIQGFRVMLPWTSTAKWNTRGTAGTDSTWTANNAAAAAANWGLADSLLNEPDYRGGTLALVDGRLSKWPLTGATHYTEQEGGYYTIAGADSLYDCEGLVGTGSARLNEPVFDAIFRTGASVLNDTLWIEVDVTSAVDMWHRHQWGNYGLVLTAELIDSKTDSYQDFDGNTLFDVRPRIVTPSYAYHSLKARRPMLIVETLTATRSANGVGGQYVQRRYPYDD